MSSEKTGAADSSAPKKRRSIAEIINKAKTILPTGEHRCVIVPDCVYIQNKLVVGNFKRHIQTHHPKEFQLLGLGEVDSIKCEKERDPVIPVRMSPKRLLGGLVKMISVNGLPLIGIDWEGMQDVIQPLCEAMNLTVNSHNMRQYVSKVATGIDKEISMEVEGRWLSLKADIAFKMCRSVLGLNAQFVDSKGELQKRTLAVAELAERHTGAYLKDAVFRILDHLGIRPQQLYSISIDNGSNMVKMASLMAKETLEDTRTYEFEEDLEGEEISLWKNTFPVLGVQQSYISASSSILLDGFSLNGLFNAMEHLIDLDLNHPTL
ncbi:uncharacterized protein LOC134219563 [Armigeres subalbatus]|uniref:uncharacterized protein LOC134219563 n=1 Tax=Armigeres subalbatus TaxID=124917 RepID=UPI002ED69910